MFVPSRTWQLRPDLEIIPAESEEGRPAVLIHDPQDGGYHRVEWPECDLVTPLRRPLSAEALLERFISINPLRPAVGDVLEYLAELGKRGWLRGNRFGAIRHREKPRPTLSAVLARLLFLQAPLLRPERFLRATSGLARLALNRAVLALPALCGLAGAYLALPRWEDFWRDSLGSFSLAAAPAFLIILVLVKTIHEFAHAYAASLAGARVETMGVALFFFIPLPYTDVTDAWRLPWRKRLRVATAGMAAETALACLALLGWALSPPGEAARLLARLSSVALMSTLLTNLNPGPRFDGYYILACLFRMENLRTRGLAGLRRLAWKAFFGIDSPDGESRMGRRRRAALLAYAAYTLLYRFGLGLALALAAYHTLPKTFGLPAAAIVSWLFIGGPVFNEARRLARSAGKMRPTIPLFAAAILFAAFIAWFAGEWPRRISFPAVTRAKSEDAVRSRAAGGTVSVTAKKGDRLAAGDAMLELASPFHEPSLRRAEWALAEAELAEEQAWRGAAGRNETGRRAAEVERRRSELEAIRLQGEYLRVVSPADGVLAAWDGTLRPGVSTGRGRVLGWVIDEPVDVLSCYARMDRAGKLENGSEVRFFPDSGEGWVGGRIVRIDESRPETLEDGALAEVLGAAPTRDGAYLLREPFAKITVLLERREGDRPLRVGQTGVVRARSRPVSLAVEAWNWLTALAVRESAF